MSVLDRSPDIHSVVLAKLDPETEVLAEAVEQDVIAFGVAAVAPLIHAVEDESDPESFAPVHAARLLSLMRPAAAAEPLVRVLLRCDADDFLYGAVIHALHEIGPPSLEPSLRAHETAGTDQQRNALCDVLVGLKLKDERILSALCDCLMRDATYGAALMADYDDPAVLTRLSAELDRAELDSRDERFGGGPINELGAAIEALGGKLTDEQRRKVHRAAALRQQARSERGAPRTAAEPPRRMWPALEQFLASEAAADAGGSAEFWIQAQLQYGLEYEDATFEQFDARVLEAVLFEHFPRKVSAEGVEARAAITALRAFWTFARDVLAHPKATECLTVLAGDAAERLREELDDPENFGMAKAFVMAGKRQGFATDTTEGMAAWSAAYNSSLPRQSPTSAEEVGRRAAEEKRRKKLRKEKKKAKRRNRR